MRRIFVSILLGAFFSVHSANGHFRVTPANSLNTRVVFGPEKFQSSGRPVVKSFSSDGAKYGVLNLRVGSGEKIVYAVCRGSGFSRVRCQLENLVKRAEVELFRPKVLSINLNSIDVLTQSSYQPETGTYVFPVSLAGGAIPERLEVVLRGTPFASALISVRAETTSVNLPPVARFTMDPSAGIAPQSVQMSALGSTDPDGNIESYEWNFGDPSSGSANSAIGAMPFHVYLNPGSYEISLKVRDNQGAEASYRQTIQITQNQLPVAKISGEANIYLDQTLNLSGVSSSDPDGLIVQYSWDLGDGTIKSGPTVSHQYSSVGTYQVQLKVDDNKGGSSTTSKTVLVSPSNVAPIAKLKVSRTSGVSPLTVEFDGSESSDENGNISSYSWSFEDGSVQNGLRVIKEFATGSHEIKLKVTDSLGLESEAEVTIQAFDPELPSAPEELAIPVSETQPQSPGELNTFLFTGANPIQTGVAAGTIDVRHISVIKGKVLQEDGSPLSGAIVSVLGEPRYGQTLTREDGAFDLAVNGGATLVLNVSRSGYYGVQRRVVTTHQAFATLKDIYMLRPDPKVTTVALGATIPQLVTGSEVIDSDGTRTATLMLPSQTMASLRMADGSLRGVSQLNIRAKEYTVGNNGPQRMPAELPSTSAYTYAVQLTADEVEAYSAAGIQFSRPISFYVDNFLGFEIGSGIPVGIYNSEKGRWEPSKNGRIIKVLSVNNGAAVLDVTGQGPATLADLAKLNIDQEELLQLGAKYLPGQSLWRIQLDHFSIVDINAFQTDVADIAVPTKEPTTPSDQNKNACAKSGSIIFPESRGLAEQIPLPGTEFSLFYSTQRMIGRAANRTLDIEVTPADLSRFQGMQGVDLKVTVAGKEFNQSFGADPGLSKRFTWDGKDIYGREMRTGQVAEVALSYRFAANYINPDRESADDSTFAFLGPGLMVTNVRSREETILTRTYKTHLGTHRGSLEQGVGSWTLNVHHQYDPISGKIYRGDAQVFSVSDIGNVVSSVAGSGVYGFSGDGGRATEAKMMIPTDMVIGNDNSIYFRDGMNARIRKVDSQGIIRTIAGNGFYADGVDGNLALDTSIDRIGGIAIDTEGEPVFYFGEGNFHKIKKITKDGKIVTIAGTGEPGFSGDGGLAVNAKINKPAGIAVRDGSVYFNDAGNYRIRVIRPDGTIQTLAGNGLNAYSGDGGPAVEASIRQPFGLSMGPNGDLYMADVIGGRIRRIDRGGVIRTIAGGGASSDDGIPATDARLVSPTKAVVAKDGSIYIGNYQMPTIKRVSPEGIITTFAGTTLPISSQNDGELAGRARLTEPALIALGPDDSLYIGDANRIKKIGRAFSGVGSADIVIPSPAGDEIYIFNSYGRHLETKFALTGATKYRFEYDSDLRLIAIFDSSNKRTQIERDSSGNAERIISAFGHETNFQVVDGYLEEMRFETGDTYRMSYGDGGMLSEFINPKGNRTRFYYDSLGQLEKDEDSVGGFKALTEQLFNGGYSIPLSTAEGRMSKFTIEKDNQNRQVKTVISSDGFVNQEILESGKSTEVNANRGSIKYFKADPRLGGGVQYLSAQSVILPGGQQRNISSNRSISYMTPSLFDYEQVDATTINGNTFNSSFNARTRTWSMTSPEGRTSTLQVDAQLKPVREASPGFSDRIYQYNSLGQLVSTQVEQKQVLFNYDSRGRKISQVDELGVFTYFAYDDRDRLIRTTYADGRETLFEYDANSNLVAVIPSGRPRHSMSYSGVDLMTQYLPPILMSEAPVRYSYNLDRDLTGIAKPDGFFASYNYISSTDQLQSIATNEGFYRFQYGQGNGKLQQMSSPDGVISNMTYNGDFLESLTQSGLSHGVLEFNYNNDHRLSSRSLNGNVTFFSYDRDGLLISSGPANYRYSTENTLLKGIDVGTSSTNLSHDVFGQVQSQSTNVGGSSVYSMSVTRDQKGRVIEKSENILGVVQSQAFNYDSVGRLVGVTTNGGNSVSYNYDSNGNRTSVDRGGVVANAAYNNQDQLTSYDGQTYQYSASGNLVSKQKGSSLVEYLYDVFGNLQQVKLSDAKQITYVIDAQNRRVGRAVNGVATHHWIYDSQLRVVGEMDGSGQHVSEFIYGSSQTPDAMIKNGVVYRIVQDHLGSPRLIVNSQSGSVLQRIDYDEFGRVLVDSNPGFQPFGFAGGLYDSETGLVRFGARDYDAEVGRWTAKDPILFEGGDTNIYSYALLDPINRIDPDGKMSLLRGAAERCLKNPDSCASIPDLANPPPLRACDPFGWGVDSESCKKMECQLKPNAKECQSAPNSIPESPSRTVCDPKLNCCK